MDSRAENKITIYIKNKSYDGRTLFEDDIFSFTRGKFCVLKGPSGCGKTTLVKMILGLEDFEGELKGIEGLKTACVFQEDVLFPWMSALDNVKLVCKDGGRALKELEFAEIADAADKYPDELSGGMKRRVCLAQALSADADLIVLDEAFTGLDKELEARLVKKVKNRFDGSNTTVIAVSHGAEVSCAADEIIEISRRNE